MTETGGKRETEKLGENVERLGGVERGFDLERLLSDLLSHLCSFSSLSVENLFMRV